MVADNVKLFITASSSQVGALGIFHVHASEDELYRTLDIRVCAKKVGKNPIALSDNELRYGWLHDSGGRILDEVMLAKPVTGMRVLMTHGGYAIRESIHAFLLRHGYEEMNGFTGREFIFDINTPIPWELFLASCKTEAQVACVLECMEGKARLEDCTSLLATRRLILAGPPNAGKSSLLNNLAGHERAFVHPEAGATTDIVDELVDLGGYAVLVGDMPGYAADGDELHDEAWSKARERLSIADAVLFVCDASQGWDDVTDKAAREVSQILERVAEARAADKPRVLVVLNKSDLPAMVEGTPWEEYFPETGSVRLCSLRDGDAAETLGAAATSLFDSCFPSNP